MTAYLKIASPFCVCHQRKKREREREEGKGKDRDRDRDSDGETVKSAILKSSVWSDTEG